MTPVEWPVAAPFEGQDAPPRAPARARLATVRRDFFLNPEHRLSEQERALMGSMLRALVEGLENDLRAALPAGWSGANDGAESELYDRMMRSDALDRAEIVDALFMRSVEESAAEAAAKVAHRRPVRTVQSLVSHDNGPVAAAAMALIMARGRRRDAFGQGLIDLDDLDAKSARFLAIQVAAQLRNSLIAFHGDSESDAALATAVTGVLGRHDSHRGLESSMAALVGLLDSADRLDDELLVAAAAEGEIAFFAHGLARRAGIGVEEAREELTSGDPYRVMLLLRMAKAGHDLAASIVAVAGDALGITDGIAAMSRFDALSDAQVEAARAWLSSPADYRAAVAGAERDRG